MSSSPAWLTIALTSLSSCTSPTPKNVLTSGIRQLPTPHILHHLNRWARHVWRPAVTTRALAALTRDPDAKQISDLGPGAVSLLSALIEAVERCEAQEWLGVLGVLFLAHDPWAIEIGRVGDGDDVDRAAEVMKTLYENNRGVLSEVAAKLSLDVRDVADIIDGDGSSHGESFAELRCRVAALQLQLDDVTAVVRRNEKNTKDLLSSFHFWSMLLLDELRSYKAQLSEKGGAVGGSSTQNGSNNGSTKTPGSEDAFEAISKSISNAVYRTGDSGARSFDRGSFGETPSNSSGAITLGNTSKQETARPKRVFRDGKWVVL